MRPGPLIVLGVVVAAAATTFAVTRPPDGAASPESAVSEYLAALGARNRDHLQRLADPENDTTGEITARLERLGGGRLMVTSISVIGTESDVTKAADITGSVDGNPYTNRFWLHAYAATWPRDGLRWFVILGPNRNAHPKPSAN
ncbi:hypothetical protein [Dactylosporangium sp. NPDC051541]|uniref:hypothetical protein n=1 Tax=Dactylosporangium sp. NPDC051541 TaxID=3363977 RepID=UPI0037906DA8